MANQIFLFWNILDSAQFCRNIVFCWFLFIVRKPLSNKKKKVLVFNHLSGVNLANLVALRPEKTFISTE